MNHYFIILRKQTNNNAWKIELEFAKKKISNKKL